MNRSWLEPEDRRPPNTRRAVDVAGGSLDAVLLTHSFSWLLIGNALGIWLALVLLVPELAAWSGSLTYGRLLPIHIDVMMYGFTSLPLIYLLFQLYQPRAGHGPLAKFSVRFWSLALAFCAVSLATGHSSGKVFVEWIGPARWVWGLALGFTAVAVIDAYFRRLAEWRHGADREDAGRESVTRMWVQGLALLALIPAPVAMIVASAPDLYPPINPRSGGSTSANTLASVLGVVFLLLLFPWLVAMKPRSRRVAVGVLVAFVAHGAFLATLEPGDHHHAEPMQWLAVLSAGVWLPLMWSYYRNFAWPSSSRLWLLAMAFWGLVLVATGIVAGTPGLAEAWKYTNALVGHVHAAAAGLTMAWLMILIDVLRSRSTAPEAPRWTAVLGDRRVFFAWQLGTSTHVAALVVLGTFEGQNPELLWSGAPVVAWCYALRLVGGLGMTFAAWRLLQLFSATLESEVVDGQRDVAAVGQALLPLGGRG